MKKALLFGFILCLISCRKTSETHDKEVAIDSCTGPKIIKHEFAKSVIFPAACSYEFYSRYRKELKLTDFFTPSLSDVKYLEYQMPKNLMLSYNPYLTHPDVDRNEVKIYPKYFDRYDKQYFGHISKEKDSIIKINVFNSESIPFDDFRVKFEKQDVFGYDGWYNSNACQFEYVKNKKVFNDLSR